MFLFSYNLNWFNVDLEAIVFIILKIEGSSKPSYFTVTVKNIILMDKCVFTTHSLHHSAHLKHQW